MTLDTFFEKFDLFADAPDAVAKMREVILQLAVSGRLVSHSKTDEPVDVDRLEEQAAPRKQAEGRSGASLDAVTDEEIPEVIPDRWVWVRLFRLCEPDAPIVYGILQPGPDARPNGVPYVRPTEIKDGRIRLSEIRHTSQDIAAQYTRATIRKGDVLLTIVGTLGATAIVPEELDGGNITQSSCRLRPDSRFIDTSYLVICLRSRTLLNQYRSFSLGSAVQRLNIAHVRALAIPLPPLAEQKRIVAKVDELMALCDRLEAQQQEREAKASHLARASLARFADAPTPANLDYLFHSAFSIPPSDLRKTILTLAVQGKLVPQDPNDEPAEVLLARIARKRTELLKAAYPNRDEASTQMRKQEAQMLPDGLESLAPGWSWATLIQASLLVVDCHNKTAPYVPSGIRLLRTTNIRDGRLNLTEPKFVDDETYERWSARCKPEPGDVLITREAPMGEVCIIPEGMKVCLGQRMMLIRLVPGTMDQKYLLYSLMAPDLMERVQDKPVGATVQHLRVGGVETLLTPIPPLAEQRRIVAKVEQLMALVDALETQLAASRTTAANLLSALVAELTVKGAECHE